MQTSLRKLSTDLDDLLRKIIYSIEPTNHSVALRLIQWALFSMRPMYAEELDLILAFSQDSMSPSSLDEFPALFRTNEHVTEHKKDFHDDADEVAARLRTKRVRRDVSSVSGGLIEVIGNSKDRQYLQAIHRSVRHFLL